MDKKKLRGQAFIAFNNVDSANLAKRSLNGTELFGKPLKIEVANQESKKIEELQKSITIN